VEVRLHPVDGIGVLEPLWQSLHQQHQGVGPRWPRWWPPERSWEIRRARYVEWLSERDAFALVAWRDRTPVGYAVVHMLDGPDDSWVTGDRIAELESLAVAEGHRGAGTGTKLMSAVLEQLHVLGVEDLWLNVVAGNDRAVEFYARYGLQPLMTLLGGPVRSSSTPSG
jgi:ribosomal protein S18 acetylase RimI-like enzyme